jgi:hypothetical protein
VEPGAIYAVAKVESGGRTGFDEAGRPKVLFEARWFHRFTHHKYDKSHPHLSQATWAGARMYYDGLYPLANAAQSLHPKPAPTPEGPPPSLP